MVNTKSNSYTFIFAVIVCVICGVMLSAFTEGLRKQQELNAELDVKRNILKAVVLKEPLTHTTTAQETLKIYDNKIQELVIDDQGNEVPDKKPEQLTEKDKNLHPLYYTKKTVRCWPMLFLSSARGSGPHCTAIWRWKRMPQRCAGLPFINTARHRDWAVKLKKSGFKIILKERPFILSKITS